jgi:hypothetical protein
LQIYERRIESSLCKIMRELESRQRRRAEDNETRRPTKVEGEPQIAGGTPATQPSAGDRTDSVKQSQSGASEGVQGTACGTDSVEPDQPSPHGQTSVPVPPVDEEETVDSAKQSQFTENQPCETKPISPPA